MKKDFTEGRVEAGFGLVSLPASREMTYEETLKEIERLEKVGCLLQANELQQWLDYRLQKAVEAREAFFDVMNEGQVKHV